MKDVDGLTLLLASHTLFALGCDLLLPNGDQGGVCRSSLFRGGGLGSGQLFVFLLTFPQKCHVHFLPLLTGHPHPPLASPFPVHPPSSQSLCPTFSRETSQTFKRACALLRTSTSGWPGWLTRSLGQKLGSPQFGLLGPGQEHGLCILVGGCWGKLDLPSLLFPPGFSKGPTLYKY